MLQEKQHLDQTQEKPFDLEKALSNMDHDRELFGNLVLVFIEESSQQMVEIREAIDKADATAAEKAAHATKGTVGNFAAQRAFELAYRLEVLGRERKLNELPEAFAALEYEMHRLRDALLNAVG